MAQSLTVPSLTIAVPFYKGAEYLRRAIESIFTQPSSPNWIVLLVDNSINEDDHAVARELALRYPDRVRYVRNPSHLTGCENLNRCIDLAETDLVSTVHCDDEVMPCYSEEFLRLAAGHPEAAILCVGVRIIDKESQPCFSFVDWFKQFLMPRGKGDFVLRGEPSLRSILRGNWINGAALCYRKSVLGDLRWDRNYPMASDLELYARALLSGRTMAGARYPAAYSYRRHAGQTTVELSANLYRFREEAKVLDRIANLAAAQGWLSAAAVGRAKITLQLHILFLATMDVAHGSFGRALQKLRLLGELRREVRSESVRASDEFRV